MAQKINIALKIPGSRHPSGRLIFRLKQALRKEEFYYLNMSVLVVFTGITGNFGFLRKSLVRAGIIDKNFRWTFADGHVVILQDSGEEGFPCSECLWLIYSLEERARRAGGYLHFLLGKRQLQGGASTWSPHPDYAEATVSTNGTYAVLYDGNEELVRWIRTKNPVEKVNNALLIADATGGYHDGMHMAVLKEVLNLVKGDATAQEAAGMMAQLLDGAKANINVTVVELLHIRKALEVYGVDMLLMPGHRGRSLIVLTDAYMAMIPTSNSEGYNPGLYIQQAMALDIIPNVTIKQLNVHPDGRFVD